MRIIKYFFEKYKFRKLRISFPPFIPLSLCLVHSLHPSFLLMLFSFLSAFQLLSDFLLMEKQRIERMSWFISTEEQTYPSIPLPDALRGIWTPLTVFVDMLTFLAYLGLLGKENNHQGLNFSWYLPQARYVVNVPWITLQYIKESKVGRVESRILEDQYGGRFYCDLRDPSNSCPHFIILSSRQGLTTVIQQKRIWKKAIDFVS